MLKIRHTLPDTTKAELPCPYCGRTMLASRINENASASRDHIVPLVWGGDDSEENRRICCKRCNERRGLSGHCVAAMHLGEHIASVTHNMSFYQIIKSWDYPKICNRLDANFLRFKFKLINIRDSMRMIGFNQEADALDAYIRAEGKLHIQE